MTIKELLVSAPVFTEFLTGLAADIESSVDEMRAAQRGISKDNPVHRAVLEAVDQQQALLARLRANAGKIAAHATGKSSSACRMPPVAMLWAPRPG